MDHQNGVGRIYQKLDADDIEGAVMACFQHAQSHRDLVNAALFLYELTPSVNDVKRTLYTELTSRKEDVRKFVIKYAVERWIEVHDVGFSFGDDEDDEPADRKTIINLAAGELDGELDNLERSINDIVVPPGLGQYDTAHFTAQFTGARSMLRLRMKAIKTIKARLRTRCFNYAVHSDQQAKVQKDSQGFLEGVQNDVNNFFKVRCEDVYLKLIKAAQLSSSKDIEDAALLLTQVRRAIKSAADYFYPPIEGLVQCADKKERKLGEEQYLNRLQEFVSITVTSSTARELLSEELDYLSAFLRRLNDLASKGVHASATLVEAKQSLVGLYFFLFNISQHTMRNTSDAGGPPASPY